MISIRFGIVVAAAFVVWLFAVPILLAVVRMFGVYTVVEERRCAVYTLFGRVIGIIDQPGIYCLWKVCGWRGLIVSLVGKRDLLSLEMDQTYLRSQAVNSEEGAPMGIGVWYEMYISDPVAFLFKNADPRGSLRANVSNASVRCLSNMKLSSMLEERHTMSRTVREEVSAQSQEWGYKVGSVYIRKVHFRDAEMIGQIEAKVVNRLRQVTSAIRQDGANQVSVITSSADREAAIEFAKAAALRPKIVGDALQQIARDPEIAETLFDILEVQRLLEGNARVTLLPRGEGRGVLASLLAAAPPAPPDRSGPRPAG